jgi:hypothetical protein
MELRGSIARGWSAPAVQSTATGGRLAAATDRVCRVRGQGLRSLLQAFSARWDAATVSRILARTQETVRSNVLHADIAASGWYPITWYGDLYRACREVTGAPMEVASELRAEALRIDARGMFRFLLKFASPPSLVGNYKRVCGLYVDGPQIEVETPRRNTVDVRWSKLVGYDRACVLDHVGGALEAIALCKGNNVRFSDLEMVRAPLAPVVGSSSPDRERMSQEYEAFRFFIHWD